MRISTLHKPSLFSPSSSAGYLLNLMFFKFFTQTIMSAPLNTHENYPSNVEIKTHSDRVRGH